MVNKDSYYYHPGMIMMKMKIGMMVMVIITIHLIG